MTETCALEIMQNNRMITIENKYCLYKITDEYYDDFIKEIKLPFLSIKIKTGGKKFDKKFRELMEKSGYISTPANNYGDSDKFIKKSDIDKFIKELPELETIYLKELYWFVEKYIEEYYQYITIKNIDNRYNKINIFKGYNTIIKLTNNKIKNNRIEQARKKEQEAIEFIEQLFK